MNHAPMNRMNLNPWKMMDRFFEEFPSRELAGTGTPRQAEFVPPCEVQESASEYLVSLDVPGIPREAIQVEVTENTLNISGERKLERTEEKASRHLVEKYYGTFTRSFSLPPGTDMSRVTAEFKDGVLKIHVPKSAGERRRVIRIGETPEQPAATSQPH